MTKKLSAYMSVEASILMGWIVFLMVFFMYTSFFLYDQCISFQDAYSIAFRASIKPVKTTQIKAYLDQHIDEQYGTKYIASTGIKKETSVSQNSVHVKTVQSITHPFGRVIPTLFHKTWTIEDSVEVSILNPTKLLRRMRKAEQLIGK